MRPIKKMSHSIKTICFTLLIIFALAGNVLPAHAQTEPSATTAFTSNNIKLQGGVVVHSSPTLADLTGDGVPEVIIGTTAQNGASANKPERPIYLTALRGNDTVLWSVQVDAPINSSPAVGDVDGDGNPEVVITTGGDVSDRSRQGSLMVFDRNGNLRWRYATVDFYPNDGYPDGAFSSPTLCDVDGNGKMEIAFGGWDQQIYLFNSDGTPRWQNLNLSPGMTPRAGYHNGDTIWSTAACADLNSDGQKEIIIGADITGGGILPDGTRPQNGGYIFVFDKDGNVLVRRHVDETVYSSPAVADLDKDGVPEIIVGTGYFWWDQTGRKKTNYVYVFRTDNVFGALPYADPAKLPYASGWPQTTPYPGFSSPAIADLDGDGDGEVVIAAGDPFINLGDAIPGAGMLHAWHHNGATVAGWPISPKNDINQDSMIFGSPAIADLDGDGSLEILIAMLFDVHVYSAGGAFKDRLPAFYTVASTPAVGDTNDDGKADIYIGGSNILSDSSSGYLWHFRSTSGSLGDTPWPMFHRNATLDGSYLNPEPAKLDSTTQNLLLLADINDPNQMKQITGNLVIQNSGGSPLSWNATYLTAAGVVPGSIRVAPTSGELAPGASATLQVQITTSGLDEGMHTMGEIQIDASSNDTSLPTVNVPVKVYVGDIDYLYLPAVRR